MRPPVFFVSIHGFEMKGFVDTDNLFKKGSILSDYQTFSMSYSTDIQMKLTIFSGLVWQGAGAELVNKYFAVWFGRVLVLK
jgi:hypothetical protein